MKLAAVCEKGRQRGRDRLGRWDRDARHSGDREVKCRAARPWDRPRWGSHRPGARAGLDRSSGSGPASARLRRPPWAAARSPGRCWPPLRRHRLKEPQECAPRAETLSGAAVSAETRRRTREPRPDRPAIQIRSATQPRAVHSYLTPQMNQRMNQRIRLGLQPPIVTLSVAVRKRVTTRCDKA